MKLLTWLLSHQLKISKIKQKTGGFTLIELLVGLLLAFLVITPLMGFMISIMENDRKEQAKVNTEQDLKAALDYMARDLQQAVYIYDADGIAAIRNQLPKSDNKTRFFPVLVFWKRQYIAGGLAVKSGNTTVGNDDTFVYSLVAYYLIKDGDSTWSSAARIGRFQISNGYGSTTSDIDSTRDPGFKLFSLQDEGSLKTKMNRWVKNSSESYTQDILPLVDYIDQTTTDTTNNPAPSCPTGQQMLPQYTGSGDAVATNDVKSRGFYVCVDSTNTVVEVNLRGNALARIQNSNIDFNKNLSTTAYFPEAKIRVRGIGYLFTQ
ncbi:hormogonium polysaccharide secretion pseudopilin HpsC [Nostoc sp. CMAA1605]|uniref:hormogonium polysaccharide secretion pseudopilin HpsC n=1 Tax=Nostoc sp. CMAA1605 TaxID=2055159 RepID=UPI001F3DE5CC|nr:hormogonium polysaccharide secretion pseudopilin HpsC [Nostoc sp. CMAA1605]MCF4970316.1 prepilin-type cleavage/methylation domain-containing protein [Nostoc sp. CMAA1605]